VRAPVVGGPHDAEGVAEALHVDLPVGDAAHHGVALEVIGLVEIDRPGDQPLEGRLARPAHQREDPLGGIGGEVLAEDRPHGPLAEERGRDLLMVRDPDLLQRMGEGVMPDVVQQRRRLDQPAIEGRDLRQFPRVLEGAHGEPGEVEGAQRMFEAGVRRAGIDQMRQAELAHVAQPLERRRVEEPEIGPLDADVVPERIAQRRQSALRARRADGRGDGLAELLDVLLEHAGELRGLRVIRRAVLPGVPGL